MDELNGSVWQRKELLPVANSRGRCVRSGNFNTAKREMQLCHKRRDKHQKGRDDFNTRWFCFFNFTEHKLNSVSWESSNRETKESWALTVWVQPQLIIASLKIRAVNNSRNWTSAHGFEQTHPISEQFHQETVPETSEGNLER